MALAIGTSSGFVTTAPTADPNGGATVTSDGAAMVTKDTAPTGAVLITEIGWYKAAGTTSSNFQVGLYAGDGAVVPGEAGTLLQVSSDAASETTAGWKVISGLNWSITPGTNYWLGVQQDAHAASSTMDAEASGGAGYDRITGQTALPDPFGGGALTDTDGMLAIYALVVVNKVISVTDSPTATDSVTVRLANYVASVTDSPTATDTPTVIQANYVISVTDSPTATDQAPSVTRVDPIVEPWTINITTDAPVATDTVDVKVPNLGNISVTDTPTATDTVTVRVPELGPISVTDTPTATDTVDVKVPALGGISVTDSPVATDSTTQYIANWVISVTDSPVATDTPTVSQANYIISVTDSPTATDTATVSLGNYTIDVSDGSVASDEVTVQVPALGDISVSDSPTVSDEVTIQIFSELPALLVEVPSSTEGGAGWVWGPKIV